LIPGSEIREKKNPDQDPRSGMNSPDNFAESLEFRVINTLILG